MLGQHAIESTGMVGNNYAICSGFKGDWYSELHVSDLTRLQEEVSSHHLKNTSDSALCIKAW